MTTVSDKIAIFPAAGSLGTSVYKHLAKFVAPERLVLVARSPDKIPKALREAGVETRQADYNKPRSFQKAFVGVSYLFLVSYPSIEIDHRFQSHRAAISAAVETNPNLKHVFYTSLGFAGKDSTTSAAHVMQAHLKTEAWLRDFTSNKALTFTAIREGIYSETWPMYTAFFDPADGTNEIVIPHDGKPPGIAWVTIDNLGEASARLVQEFTAGTHDKYVNKVVLLSGPKAWSLQETADVLSKLVGRTVTIKQGSHDDYVNNAKVRQALDSHGPGEVTAQWVTVYKAITNGETSVVTDEVERLLGRPAEDFETTVKRMLQKS